eukprot:1374147-Alexandrium_andersonii.AAC.1
MPSGGAVELHELHVAHHEAADLPDRVPAVAEVVVLDLLVLEVAVHAHRVVGQAGGGAAQAALAHLHGLGVANLAVVHAGVTHVAAVHAPRVVGQVGGVVAGAKLAHLTGLCVALAVALAV